ncbi:MAG TPA: AI-2E family transporter [Candidatus Baltobacteraceae bacterium]
MNAIDWRRVFRIAGVVLVVLAALWFASLIPKTIALFLIAAFIAFGIQPLVVKLQERKVPRLAAIAIVFTLLIVLLVLGLLFIVPLTVDQVSSLATNAPSYLSNAQGWLADGEAWLRERFPSLNIPANVFDVKPSGANVGALVTGMLANATAILGNVFYSLLIAFSALILSIFFLTNDHQIAESFASMFPEKRRATARKLSAEITQLFGSYISGQIIVSTITGVVVALLSWAVGFKFALLLGIITVVAYSIPIFGMLIAQVVALILCAPQGLGCVLWVQAIMFGMARISDNILVPKIMGDSVGVSPIGVMFAVFAGGELFGLPGLLLGIPAAALIKILWRYFVTPWLHRQMDGPAAGQP